MGTRSKELVLCPAADCVHDRFRLATIKCLKVDEVVAKGHGEGVEGIQCLRIGRNFLPLIAQYIHQFAKVMGLTERYRVQRQDSLETFLHRLLRMKSNRLLVAIGGTHKEPQGFDITISQSEKAASKINGSLHVTPCPL